MAKRVPPCQTIERDGASSHPLSRDLDEEVRQDENLHRAQERRQDLNEDLNGSTVPAGDRIQIHLKSLVCEIEDEEG